MHVYTFAYNCLYMFDYICYIYIYTGFFHDIYINRYVPMNIYGVHRNMYMSMLDMICLLFWVYRYF